MGSDVVIRYAESDDDIINIHRFLLAVAAPTLPGPVDPVLSIHEVWRVVTHEVALMAIRDDKLVGTLGIIQASHWWGKVGFWANRWFFTLPGSRAGKPLLAEAKKIAVGTEMELQIFDENGGRIRVFNKSSRRSNADVLRQHVHHAANPAAADGDVDAAVVAAERGAE